MDEVARAALAAFVAQAEATSPFVTRPVLAWSADAGRILHASDGARALAAALVVDAQGTVRPDLAARERLAALAGGLAPEGAQRLERLRFRPGRLAAPTTLACRRLPLETGESVLLTAFLDGPPVLAPFVREPDAAPVPESSPSREDDGSGADEANDVAPPDAAAPEPEPEPRSEPEPAPDPLAEARARLSGRGAVRFVWRADADGRVREVSPALADTVGAESAAIVGRGFAEILADVAHDPREIVAELVARGETFSGRTVLWRVAGTPAAVEIDLAGLPSGGRGAGAREMRGFGLIRTDALVLFPARPEPVPQGRDDAAPVAEPDVAETPEPSTEETGRTDLALDPEYSAVPEPAALLDDGPALAPQARFAVAAGERYEPMAELATPVALASIGAPAQGRLGEARPDLLAAAPSAPPSAPPSAAPSEPLEDLAPSTPANDVDARAPAGGDVPPQPPRPASAATASLRLSPSEHSAFREIARALGARYAGDEEPEARPAAAAASAVAAFPARPARPAGDPLAAAALERIPLGVVVHRGEETLHANRHLLDLLGHADLDAFRAAGGVAGLVKGRPGALARVEALDPAPLALAGADGASFAAEVRLATLDLEDGPASLLVVRRLPDGDPVHRVRALEIEAARLEAALAERDAILDTATDGVVVVDGEGRIHALNRAAQALFGYEANEIAGEPFTALFETESHAAALDYLASLGRAGVASLLDGGREVLGRVRQRGAIPLFMTLGRVGEAGTPEGEGREPARFCAVLRDMTAFKQAESELLEAKRAAEAASAQKSDFLARISHEVRTPLNAIIGFAEVMREERFGAIGNERYKDYLADIHASGQHVLSLINDLLDLAKIEAGRMDLSFRTVGLNELVGACVALMQPEAARERIVMRTSLLARLPQVVGDERSLRQIVLNLLSNAVRFTDPGGQVIVSTALTDRGEIAFRVRDTGIGMSPSEVEAALEPFRQLATARRPGGTGLGLPLTKALVEANRGAMTISSRKGEGTLVEVTFPATVGVGA
ncbi:PAS domain-containing sensor histidine kinase [Salinarimonas chemoclinalis]|uniref:PAS domain-containing sensor histidine kinase n=1 Tax=Salinarimonas chemoclinalis TaxID=3241599 RepID=UPI0035569FA0